MSSLGAALFLDRLAIAALSALQLQAALSPDGAWRSRAWSPDLLHEFLMDHLGAQPDPWMTYHAVFDHPTGEFVSKIRQPFLVLDVHDDLIEQTKRAMPLLPAHTRVVSRPDLTDVLELFTTAADEIADYFEEFFV